MAGMGWPFMKIHHFRNATLVIESGDHHILIDPMLSDKGRLPPFAHWRHKPRPNPTVDLPANACSPTKKPNAEDYDGNQAQG
jgi:L-ascorbate metabolism protein UlaG (beta-lactamase superfamily)